MSRLPTLLHARDAWVAGVWVTSAAVTVTAAISGWGGVLAVALLVNYVADALFFAVDERAVTWFDDRQMAAVQRHLFREAFAVLGWVVLERPSAIAVALVVSGIVVIHATHVAYRFLSTRDRRIRRGRLGWVGLDVDGRREGPEVLPPTLPQIWTVSGPRFALHLDVFLVIGLWASWTLDSLVPVWVGLGLVGLGALFVVHRVIARHRLIVRLPSPAQDNARLLNALEAHAPEVVVYFSGGPDTTYQLNVWLETIDRLHQPAVIFIREFLHLEALLPTTTPVVVLPRAQSVEAFQLPSMKVVLYPTTVIKNNHMIRLRGLRHVFINHGDGDKSVTYSPLHRVFDEIWVAGRAACDRYLDRGEGVRPDQLVTVGRPQLAHIATRDASRPGDRPLTVLYAPTWEGNFDGVDYSSVARMGERIVDALMSSERDVRVLFKAHPATGSRLETAATARAAIESRLGSDPRHEVVGSEPDALYGAFNEADILIGDISSVVADFLASRKPYLVTNPRDLPTEAFHRDFPSTRGGGVVGSDLATLIPDLDDAAGPDVRRARREELAAYYLGEPHGDPVERFAYEVTAACHRAGEALGQSAAIAFEAATEETPR